MNTFERVFNSVTELVVETVTFGAYLGSVVKTHTYTHLGKVVKTGAYLGAVVTNGVKKYEHDTYNLELKVMGVKRGNLQEVIRSLEQTAKVELVRVPTKEHPYETEVRIGGVLVGYVSDINRNSIAKMLLEKERRGINIRVLDWYRVGGVSSAPIMGIRVVLEIDIEKEVV